MDKPYQTSGQIGGTNYAQTAQQQFDKSAGISIAKDRQINGPFGHAAVTFERVTELAGRVQRLADRLAGSVLTDTQAGSAAQRVGAGVFDALDVTCFSVDRDIAEANEALSRIESLLP